MKYVRGLKFEEKPDYEYCVKFFSTIMSKHEYENDGEFDWILLRRRNNVRMKIICKNKICKILYVRHGINFTITTQKENNTSKK